MNRTRNGRVRLLTLYTNRASFRCLLPICQMIRRSMHSLCSKQRRYPSRLKRTLDGRRLQLTTRRTHKNMKWVKQLHKRLAPTPFFPLVRRTISLRVRSIIGRLALRRIMSHWKYTRPAPMKWRLKRHLLIRLLTFLNPYSWKDRRLLALIWLYRWNANRLFTLWSNIVLLRQKSDIRPLRRQILEKALVNRKQKRPLNSLTAYKKTHIGRPLAQALGLVRYVLLPRSTMAVLGLKAWKWKVFVPRLPPLILKNRKKGRMNSLLHLSLLKLAKSLTRRLKRFRIKTSRWPRRLTITRKRPNTRNNSLVPTTLRPRSLTVKRYR